MRPLVELFFQLSNAMLVPVMVLLVAGLAVTAVGVGRFLGEWVERRTRGPAFVAQLAAALDRGEGPGTLGAVETRMQGRVARASLLVRMGPTLGLMGTLIPMGPALTELARGDLEQMAQKLVIAFSTTVVGLLIGGTAALIGSVRRRWYDADLRRCDALVEEATGAV